jgi:hypothetical protein
MTLFVWELLRITVFSRLPGAPNAPVDFVVRLAVTAFPRWQPLFFDATERRSP